MNRNQKIALAVALLAAAVIVAAFTGGGTVEVRSQEMYYFYDLADGTLFEAASARPPVDAPGGANQGVLAYIYGCGSCAEGARKIAYLKTYSDEAQAAFNQPPPTDPEAGQALAETIARGALVASPPAERSEVYWVPEMSEEGERVVARVQTLCDLQTPQACLP